MITIDDIRAAQARIGQNGRVTPLLSSPFLDEIAGRRLWVKAECLQHTGSFKFRGGWAAVSALSDAQRKAGVLAYSSGNHAQGVAYAARAMGAPATIIMPHDAPAIKRANTEAMGAKVVSYERGVETRDGKAAEVDPDGALSLIKPYDQPMVMAGQGTCGLELAEQAAGFGIENADVAICCGGGGLTSGVALALETDAPGLRVRPAEPEGFDDTKRSLISGHREINNRETGSLCDAILTPSPGEFTFPIIQRLCGPGLVVSDEDALRASALAFERLRIVVEPGGAVGLAAALFYPEEFEGDDVIAIATGGNVDASIFKRALDTL